jgi:hypothetical protein
MDDFQIIDGKPYCTMQLVLSEGVMGLLSVWHTPVQLHNKKHI